MRTVNPADHARQRARILSAAAREFATAGIDGTSTAAICRRAGIGSGTLFHYFPTKRDIVHALFADDLPQHEQARAAALAADDPRTGITVLLDALAADVGDPAGAGLVAAAVLQAGRDPEFAAMLAGDDEKTRGVLTELVRRLRRSGVTTPFLPAATARWIMQLIDAAYLAGDQVGRTHRRELVRIVGWLTGLTEDAS